MNDSKKLVMFERKFPLGRILMTPGVRLKVSLNEMRLALIRDSNGDRGDTPDSDRKANDVALKNDCMLLSSYRTKQGLEYWIITEADRSVTTVVLPEER